MTAVAEPFDSHVARFDSPAAGSAGADVIPLRPTAPAGNGFLGAPAPAVDLEGDPLRDVSTASARLERLQWERDAAEEELCAALRRASDSSVSAAALARAAGVTLPELETYLQRPAWDAGAAASNFWLTGL